jgi:hypothetical protein
MTKKPLPDTTAIASTSTIAKNSNSKEQNTFKNKISTIAKETKLATSLSTTSATLTTATTTATATSTNALLNRFQKNDMSAKARLAASIAGFKRKQLLIDLDKPRKSPREHASTLAILSSLIHQRKKRDSVTGLEIGETSSSNSNYLNKLTESILNNDDNTNSSNSNLSSCNTEVTTPVKSPKRKPGRPFSRTKKLARQNSANEESSLYSLSTATILNREDNIYTSATCCLKRQVDNLLNNAYLDDDIDNMSIDIKFDDDGDEEIKQQHSDPLLKFNLMDIDLNDPKRDFVELMSSDLSGEPFTIGAAVKKEIKLKRSVHYDVRKPRPMGPVPKDLRWTGSKKKTNRTGWPNVVKRKIVTRKTKKSVDEDAGDGDLCDDETVVDDAETTVFKYEEDDDDDTQIDNESVLTNDVDLELDDEDSDLRPPKLKSEDNNSLNSEIFIVSSDSLDTLNTSVVDTVAVKTDIDNLSTKSIYEDASEVPFVPDIADVVKNHSRRKTQQNQKYFSSQYTNHLPYFMSSSSSSPPSSSKKLSPDKTSINNSLKKNSISTRSTPAAAKRKSTPKKPTSPIPTPRTTTTTQNNNNRATSPSSPAKSPKYSPHKLRKQFRGKWYKER